MTWRTAAGQSSSYGDEQRGDPKLSIALRKLLKARNMSQREVADATGIRKETISRILSGRRRPSAQKLMLIASAIGVSVEEIMWEMEQAEIQLRQGQSTESDPLVHKSS